MTNTDAYNAWGSRTTTGGGDVFTYGAQWGYYTDGETSLVLCGHRYYDPAQGRWLNRDPIGYRGGVDIYHYVDNSPSVAVDPTGDCPACIYVIGSGLVDGIESAYNNGNGWSGAAFVRGLVEGSIVAGGTLFGPPAVRLWSTSRCIRGLQNSFEFGCWRILWGRIWLDRWHGQFAGAYS